MPPFAQLGQTTKEALDAFHAASLRSYPTIVEARDQIGRVYRWCPEAQHPIATLGIVRGYALQTMTDTEHSAFEALLAAGRIRILEHRRGGYEKVLHDARALS